MDADIKSKWIAALRSGEYQQGQGGLRLKTVEGFKYCCLGVLCDVVDPSGWGSEDSDLHRGNSGMPSRSHLSMFPHEKINGEYVWDILVCMNDENHASFAAIADFIEQCIPEDV